MSWKTGDCYVLRSPHEGYLVEVSFTVYPDHPEYVHVRSTNWRAEHEPHGIFEIGAARKFYKDLIGAGFVQIQQGH